MSNEPNCIDEVIAQLNDLIKKDMARIQSASTGNSANMIICGRITAFDHCIQLLESLRDEPAVLNDCAQKGNRE